MVYCKLVHDDCAFSFYSSSNFRPLKEELYLCVTKIISQHEQLNTSLLNRFILMCGAVKLFHKLFTN